MAVRLYPYKLNLPLSGQLHLQLARRNLFHPRRRGPGALLQLQLPPFHVHLLREFLLFLQLDVKLARLVLRSDHAQCANHYRHQQQCIQCVAATPHRCAPPRASPRCAATGGGGKGDHPPPARAGGGGPANPPPVARTALPTRCSLPCGTSLARIGTPRGSLSPSAMSRMKCFTMRSSSE